MRAHEADTAGHPDIAPSVGSQGDTNQSSGKDEHRDAGARGCVDHGRDRLLVLLNHVDEGYLEGTWFKALRGPCPPKM